jgi:hypothetical protein
MKLDPYAILLASCLGAARPPPSAFIFRHAGDDQRRDGLGDCSSYSPRLSKTRSMRGSGMNQSAATST